MGQTNSTDQKDGLSVRFSQDALDFIEGLSRLRILGGNKGEVIRRFVDEGIERVTRDRIIENTLKDRELLAEHNRDSIRKINKEAGGV